MTILDPKTTHILPLNVAQMQLRGQHIIEASAGTGKTFNITRIFIRLLLVKEVSAAKVLIVTFTKAATQELRGRIAKEVNQLLNDLRESPDKIDDSFVDIIKQVNIEQSKQVVSDNGEFFTHELSTQETSTHEASTNEASTQELPTNKLSYGIGTGNNSNVDHQFEVQIAKAIRLLSVAALDLDDASIFTIHGFCQRVIKQSAFLRQQTFSPNIVSSSEPYLLQEVQDWFRRNYVHKDKLEQLAYLGAASPSRFMAMYKNALFGYTTIMPIALEDNTQHLSKEAFRQKLTDLEQSMVDMQSAFLQDNNDALRAIKQVFVEYEKEILSVLNEKKWAHFETIREWVNAPFVSKLTKGALNAIFIPKEMNAIAKVTSNALDIADKLKAFKDHILVYFENEVRNTDEVKKITASYDQLAFAHACQVAYEVIIEVKEKANKLKQKADVIDHDDTIHGLAKSIRQGNQDLVTYIQSQYPYALIDEFQDTDKDQYSIFSHCYPTGSQSFMLLMIGDPKQAIYGFRGGDINTYILARNKADYAWTMQHNYRSSQQMIDAYNVLFYGAKLTDSSIDTIKQSLPLSQQDTKGASFDVVDGSIIEDALLFDANIPYPWIYQGKPPKEVGLEDESAGAIHFIVNENLYPKAPDGRKAYKIENTQALAAEVLRLTQRASIDGKAVAFKDIAILVSSARQAAMVQSALNSAGLACVYLSEKSDIFESEQALALFYALDGILHSNQNHKFFRALSTDLFGLSPALLLQMQKNMTLFDEYKELMYRLKQTWAQDGILVMINTLVKSHFSSRTTLTSKERILTNYMHLAELLNTQSNTSEHAYQLLNWLKKQLPQNDAEADEDADRENAQRLESDEALIKIVTLHGSKGLEYPIVFIPFAGYKPYEHPNKNLVRYFNEQAHDTLIQIGEDETTKALKSQQHFAEQKRLLYVGITRAVHRCYLGIGGKSEFEKSALFALLEPQSIKCPVNDIVKLVQADDTLFNLKRYTFEDLHAHQQRYLELQNSESDINQRKAPLIASTFTGQTGQAWQLESFSKISRQLKYIDLSAKERDENAFEKQTPTTLFASDETEKRIASDPLDHNTEIPYRFTIEKSADTGNLLHNILEDHDFSQTLALTEENAHISFFISGDRKVDTNKLSTWLNEVLNTPIPIVESEYADTKLTVTTNNLRLSCLNPSSVLKEPEFYFPLHNVNTHKIHKLLLAHRQQVSNNNSPNAPSFFVDKLEGMMHGFIDLLFVYEGKYYVADYKSNFLGNTQENYDDEALQQAIEAHNYDLQYLIYTWALDRYLQARLKDYERGRDFGGVYYLFLRGMSPEFTPGNGIYHAYISDDIWRLLDETFNASCKPGVAV